MVQRFPVALTADQARPKTGEQAEPWLEAAFRQHWSRVYAVLFRLVGDGDEAEDLALETFWRLYRRSPVTDENKLGGWLYRVATNLGFNALRTRRRRQQYEAMAGVSALEQGSPADPALAVEHAQERQRVQTALERMKPALRQAPGAALFGTVLYRNCRGDRSGARLCGHPAGPRRNRIRAPLPPA